MIPCRNILSRPGTLDPLPPTNPHFVTAPANPARDVRDSCATTLRIGKVDLGKDEIVDVMARKLLKPVLALTAPLLTIFQTTSEHPIQPQPTMLDFDNPHWRSPNPGQGPPGGLCSNWLQHKPYDLWAEDCLHFVSNWTLRDASHPRSSRPLCRSSSSDPKEISRLHSRRTRTHAIQPCLQPSGSQVAGRKQGSPDPARPTSGHSHTRPGIHPRR
jgi:hypothetical protein